MQPRSHSRFFGITGVHQQQCTWALGSAAVINITNITMPNITINITEEQLSVLRQALCRFKADPSFLGLDLDIRDAANSLTSQFREKEEELGI